MLGGVWEREQGRFLLWLPVLLGLGIALYFSLPHEPARWTGWALIGGMAVAALGLARHPGALALVPLAVCLGFAGAQWRAHGVAAPVLESRVGPVALQGRLVALERRETGWRLTLEEPELDRLEPPRTPHRVRVAWRGDLAAEVLPGARIALRAVLLPPPGPAAPGAYDFSRGAWFERLGAVGYAVRAPVRVGDARAGLGLAADVARLRIVLAERLRAALPGDKGAVAAALLTGDRGAIREPVLAALRDSGLAHLLAISGLHIGLLAMVVFVGLRAVLALSEHLALHYPIKKLAALAALVAAFGYLQLTGATIPTQRAFIMVALGLAAVLLDRQVLSMRLVAVAAMVVLLLAPESLETASFQMSFAAVVALIAAYEVASVRFGAARRGARPLGRAAIYLVGVLFTTLIAGTATAPFALFHFNRVVAFGLVANMVAVPLMAFAIMPFGVLAYVLMPLGLERLALVPMGWAIDAVIRVAEVVAGWPSAVHFVPAMPVQALPLIVLAGLWLCLWRSRIRLAALPVLAAGLAFAFMGRPADLYVSDDASRVGIRQDGRLLLSPSARRGFETDIWAGRMGLDPAAVTRDGLSCDRLGCLYRHQTGLVAHLRDERALGEDCALARVLVSAEPLHDACAGPELAIGRFDTWRNGAYAVRFEKRRILIETVADRHGRRLWSPGPRRNGG